MAEPGECFDWDSVLKGVEGFVRGYFGKEKAKELVKSLKADFQNYKHLRQREFD
nr:piscidin-1 [Oreochromis niloticus]